MPGGTSRWNRGKDSSWEPLRPERVCEVSYDHLQGNRFRHATHFRRWRPDKTPRTAATTSWRKPRPTNSTKSSPPPPPPKPDPLPSPSRLPSALSPLPLASLAGEVGASARRVRGPPISRAGRRTLTPPSPAGDRGRGRTGRAPSRVRRGSGSPRGARRPPTETQRRRFRTLIQVHPRGAPLPGRTPPRACPTPILNRAINVGGPSCSVAPASCSTRCSRRRRHTLENVRRAIF